jgi:predicted ATPase
VDDSLLRRQEDASGEPRFGMLETIREYGLERLVESGEVEAIRERHAQCFLALAEEAEPELGSDAAGVERLEVEHDNLRAALDWCAGRSPEAGLRLAGALGQFWYIRSHYAEGRRRLVTALAGSASVEPPVRAKALCAGASIAAMRETTIRRRHWVKRAWLSASKPETGGARLDRSAPCRR